MTLVKPVGTARAGFGWVKRELPHPQDVVDAMGWLMAGAPAAARGHEPKKAVRTLLQLIEMLPEHLLLYAWGSSENKLAYLTRGQERAVKRAARKRKKADSK